ncbi:Hypothetical predicted protein [Xyrichtys novacula]|uniref:Uncharacterized protein n=1 Tax=Xyrichtys novacula TaxID=13765 RepID=A0AAV1GAT2_XYRNO|nr:Hypothetical predicted protein [Xyrichtys novacula]
MANIVFGFFLLIIQPICQTQKRNEMKNRELIQMNRLPKKSRTSPHYPPPPPPRSASPSAHSQSLCAGSTGEECPPLLSG